MSEDALTLAGERLGERLKRLGDEAKAVKGKVVPMGMEKVDAEAEARRWQQMGADERRRFIKAHGVEHALDTDKRARRIRNVL